MVSDPQHMTHTRIALDRLTIRSISWPVMVVAALVLIFVEPWLAERGVRWLAFVVYAVAVSIVALSLVFDIQAMREQ